MNKTTITRASKIIFANEGGYDSVNPSDNGAVSVGLIQWHGTRALNLLKEITNALGKDASIAHIGEKLYKEIQTATSWNTRIANPIETDYLEHILSTPESHRTQDDQADEDVMAYLSHVESLGVEEENAQIFMADIENQGGAGASSRIIENAQAKDLDSLYLSAVNDRVFKNYIPRRNKVYQILTGHPYGEKPYDGIVHEVRYGDTLGKIAKEYNTTVAEIVDLNGITNPNLIRVGDLIKIPNTKQEVVAPVVIEENVLYSVNIRKENGVPTSVIIKSAEQEMTIPIKE